MCDFRGRTISYLCFSTIIWQFLTNFKYFFPAEIVFTAYVVVIPWWQIHYGIVEYNIFIVLVTRIKNWWTRIIYI